MLEVRNLPAASFQALGDLSGGEFDSSPHDLSEDGTTIVGFGTSGSGREAFRWTQADGMVGLGDLPDGRYTSVGFGVSADGSVVAGYGYPTDFSEAFRWTQADGMVGLGFLPGQDVSGAYGISADGTVIVGQAPVRPFRWTATTGMTDLGDLGGGTFGQADAASTDGSVVVGFGSSVSGLEAFRWTEAGGMVGLGSLSTTNFKSGALDLSADGSVVVGWSRSGDGYEAFRWTAENGMVGLGDLPGGVFSSQAEVVSTDGSVIVGTAHVDPGSDVDQWQGESAFIWDSDNGMRSLRDVLINEGIDLTGWRLIEATGMSADGRTITGAGINPSHHREAWIAHLATSVSINQAVGQADPTVGSTVSFDVVFSRPVTGFDDTDIDLSASTVSGTLVATVTGSGRVYAVTVTGMNGFGTVTANIPAAAGIDDFGEATATSASTDNTVTFNNVVPTVTIDQGTTQLDPTDSSPITFGVYFSQPVAGFDGSDVMFTGSTVGGALMATVSGVSPGQDYTVSVTGMAGIGTVVASIQAGTAVNNVGTANAASTSTDNVVTFDDLPPAVIIDQSAGQADPTKIGPIIFTVHFSEYVTGFDESDISFVGSTVGGALVASVSGSGADYELLVTGMSGQGTVVARIPTGAAIDATGNSNSASTSTDNTVTFDNLLPSVTINQALRQSDPTNVDSIKFDVKFSEAVTGFTGADVDLSTSTAGGTLVATVSGNLDTYVVTVTGMTTRGFVVATIPAGAALDLVGNASFASTSTDNSVEFLNTGTLAFTQSVINTTEDETAHTVTITVTRTGNTEGAVSIDYGTTDDSAHHGGASSTGQDDYTPAGGTLSWADGEGGDKTFTVTILPDALNEGKELVKLTLSNPIGSPGLGVVNANVAIGPSDGQGPGKYTDQDGDKYTIKLNGRTGSLLWFRTDPDGDGKGPIELIELTGTLPDPLKPKAALVVSVVKSKTTTDGGTVGLGAITGPGLASISARKASLNLEGINLNGYLGSLTIGSISNSANITTLATTNPKQKTKINALAIGDSTDIDVGAVVSSFTATSFGNGSFKAPSVGTLAIKGNMAADVTISGVGVDPTKKALSTMKVTGAVTSSDIFVTGNIGNVTVGAFRDSRLFAGYTGADDGTGSFSMQATVTKFNSTGPTDGFQNSRVIATNFKSVTIKSLDSTNSANKFGFYADTSLGAINVIGPTKFKYNSKLPTPQGIGDFELKLV
jgi:probable HAF family extracellular repeat protein